MKTAIQVRSLLFTAIKVDYFLDYSDALMTGVIKGLPCLLFNSRILKKKSMYVYTQVCSKTNKRIYRTWFKIIVTYIILYVLNSTIASGFFQTLFVCLLTSCICTQPVVAVDR